MAPREIDADTAVFAHLPDAVVDIGAAAFAVASVTLWTGAATPGSLYVDAIGERVASAVVGFALVDVFTE
jgi:hypothetical protein